MKKVITGLTSFIAFDMVCGMETAIVQAGENRLVTTEGSVGTMSIRPGIQNIEVYQTPEIRYGILYFPRVMLL